MIRIRPWLTALAVVIVMSALGGIAFAADKTPEDNSVPPPAPAAPAASESAPVPQALPVLPDLQQAQADAQKAQQDAVQQAQADLQQPPAAVQQPDQQPNQLQKPADQPDSLPSAAPQAAAANPLSAPPSSTPQQLNSASASDPRFWDPSRSNNFDDWRNQDDWRDHRDRDRDDDGISNSESIRNVRSGSANPSVNISNTGDNVNMCLGLQQVANTGNVANQQGLSQYNSDTDDIDFEGSGIEITPDLTVECNQTIIQAAAAGNPLAQAVVQSGALAPASAPASAPVAAVATGGGAGPSVGLPVARGAGLAQLPRTGGLMTLPLAVLGLSGLGGGLMIWRLRR